VKIYREKGIEWDNEPLMFSELLMYFLENDYNGGVINIWFDEYKEYLF